MRPRPVLLSLTLLMVTVAAGLAIRFARIGLPAVLVKFRGSALWAPMVDWVCSSLLPRLSFQRAAMLAGIVATGVEFFKLIHVPWLDAFRLTLPDILLLGRIFSGWDILVYWVAIGVGALLDARVRAAAQSTAAG
jgi:hypothetical protein